MKLILAILCLASSLAHSAMLSGTVDYYRFENNLTPTWGSDTWGGVGTMTFYTSFVACEGTYTTGLYSSTKYLSSTAVGSSMAGDQSWSAEGYIYLNTNSNGPVFCVAYAGPSNYVAIRILTNGAVRMIVNDVSFNDSTSGLVATGACYTWGMNATNTQVTGHIGTGTISAAVVTLTADSTWPASSAAYLGVYPPAVALFGLTDGYLDAVRFNSVLRSSFPSVDPPDTPTVTVTPTSTPTPEISQTFTVSPTATRTWTRTVTPTPTATKTATGTPSKTTTRTVSPTATPSPRNSRTATPTMIPGTSRICCVRPSFTRTPSTPTPIPGTCRSCGARPTATPEIY